MKKNKSIKKWIFIVIIAVVVKVFFFDYTIYRGDNILPNSDGYIVLILSKKAKPQKADIVLINKPFENERTQVFARCIAVGGDIVEIKNSVVYVNNDIEVAEYDIVKKYRINCFSDEATNKLKNDYKLIDSIDILGVYYLNLTTEQALLLKDDSLIKIHQIIIDKELGNSEIFPQSFKYRWNEDNFGALIIPYKGFKIELNEMNFTLYKNTFIYFENIQIENKDGLYYVDGKQILDYTFKNSYYFVLNDNRTNYADSRTWGMIPKSQIEGTVAKIIKK